MRETPDWLKGILFTTRHPLRSIKDLVPTNINNILTAILAFGFFLILSAIFAWLTIITAISGNSSEIRAQRDRQNALQSAQSSQQIAFNKVLTEFFLQQDFICSVLKEEAIQRGLPVPTPDPCHVQLPKLPMVQPSAAATSTVVTATSTAVSTTTVEHFPPIIIRTQTTTKTVTATQTVTHTSTVTCQPGKCK